MTSEIFINYRGRDCRGYGALLFAELSRRYGRDSVFFASESIPAGADSADRLLHAAQRCQVLLAVIGERWLTTTDARGRRKIDDPSDWVRRELTEAHAAGATVIPILTDDAQLPTEPDLPAEIAWLARVQYRRLRYREATADIDRICTEVEGKAVPAATSCYPLLRSQLPVTPAQLPRGTNGFIGREEHIACLDRLLFSTRSTSSAVVVAVSGAAGVGKTALAVHWAHRVAPQFPDGQLHVNLRGFDSSGQVMPPSDVVSGFLDALGVPADRVPASSHAQAALYRSLLAGKRILVLLDNARNAEQVRSLLPGTPEAFVIVTSRDKLTPLIAVEGARPVDVGVLTGTEARQLLVEHLGDSRVSAEPLAATEIIDKCARLPLALSIATARARRDDFPLAAVAMNLDQAPGLTAFNAGDPRSRIQSVFSWSFSALNETAARLFRLLGLHPGPDTSTAAAATLADTTLAEARATLDELTSANLVAEYRPGRYISHDLLRAYAAELAHDLDSQERCAAVGRMLNYYTRMAYSAAQQLEPHRDPSPLPATVPSAARFTQSLDTGREATEWLSDEYPVIAALIRGPAHTDGFDVEVWQLSWALDTFLTRRGRRRDLATIWRIALDAAERTGKPQVSAHSHRSLALAYTLSNKYTEACLHYERALELFASAEDVLGQAHTHRHVAYLMERQGRPDVAFEHAQTAHRLYLDTNHCRGQARALNNVGWYHALLGRYEIALQYCRQALVQLTELGDRWGQAGTWDSLGYAYHHVGQPIGAIYCYRQAIAMFEELGNRYDEATTLIRLAESHGSARQIVLARNCLQAALNIFIELAHPDAKAAQVKIQDLILRSPYSGVKFATTLGVYDVPQALRPAASAESRE